MFWQIRGSETLFESINNPQCLKQSTPSCSQLLKQSKNKTVNTNKALFIEVCYQSILILLIYSIITQTQQGEVHINSCLWFAMHSFTLFLFKHFIGMKVSKTILPKQSGTIICIIHCFPSVCGETQQWWELMEYSSVIYDHRKQQTRKPHEVV